ncbi:MAG: MBL fold metallo-hydrolase, partial [Methanomicrobiales archaeon]|nr:MBL fold metallo-hydrolase [Methanomicrobiales archaeon]
MRLTLLGSGDAVGTPKVGCRCPVCAEAVRSGRQRLRTSLLVQ